MLAITKLATIPLRAEAKDSSEMVSQLLFGETFEILDRKDNWLFIQQTYDQYQGWIDEKQCLQIQELPNPKHCHTTTSLGIATQSHNPTIPQSLNSSLKPSLLLSPGSTLPDYKNGQFKLGTQTWQYKPYSTTQLPNSSHIAHRTSHEKHNPTIPQSLNSSLNPSLQSFLGTPYLWGGRSIFGIDCSGLTQVIYKMMGITILRDASQQATQGTTVEGGAIQEGDLAFFSTKSDKITHVGIIIKKDRIIHAHGQVRIDRLDEKGIYNEDQKKHTHLLRWVRNYQRI